MDTAVTTGLFALSGAVLAAAAGWISVALQRRWAKQDARENRANQRADALHQHKVDSYLAVLDESRALTAASYRNTLDGGGPAPEDATVELGSRVERVGVFGTPAAARCAKQLLRAMQSFVEYPDPSPALVAALDLADTNFKNAVRDDLGVEGRVETWDATDRTSS